MLRSHSACATASTPSILKRSSTNRLRSIRPLFANGDSYDYVIVGGGAAGCLLANRLSADENNNVLLIEAGTKKQNYLVDVPAGITQLFKSQFDWNLYSTIQEQLNHRSVYVARGKVIGGSTSTNATLYHRGTAEDYDAWNLEGWQSKDVLPFFRNIENHPGPKSDMHGKGGWMHIERPRYENPLHDIMMNAAHDMGLSFNPDFNDWSHPQEGYGEFNVTQKRGVRADAFKQFLRPALKRDNLFVLSEAKVTKVLFENSNSKPRAVGVEYRKNGAELLKREASLESGGEVILCAGAIHSPHLLLLSGIGPANVIRNHGIELIRDLPGVGKDLQDHPAVVVASTLKPKYREMAVTNVFDQKGAVRWQIRLKYALLKQGPMCTTSCDHGAFLTTPGHRQPNVQIRFNAGFALDPDGVSSFVKFGEILKSGGSWPPGITLQVVACRPKSRGSVSLASDDPLDNPAINIGFLSDPEGEDLKTLIDGIRFCRAMTETPSLSGFLEKEGFPGSEKKTDEELKNFILDTVHSANAVVGTCRMGVDEGSVVSSKDMKVHGIDGLRVIDASVMPRLPGGQTGAPTVMIAEKAAFTILNPIRVRDMDDRMKEQEAAFIQKYGMKKPEPRFLLNPNKRFDSADWVLETLAEAQRKQNTTKTVSNVTQSETKSSKS